MAARTQGGVTPGRSAPISVHLSADFFSINTGPSALVTSLDFFATDLYFHAPPPPHPDSRRDRAHGEQIVLVKRKQERIEHVWMKAFLWALYLPSFPDLSVEVDVGDKYKPDVVALAPRRGRPLFWGEAGHVGPEKIASLVGRYPRTPLSIAKWARSLDPVRETVKTAVRSADRVAPIDLLRIPADSAERFVDNTGRISISWDDVEWERVGPAEAGR